MTEKIDKIGDEIIQKNRYRFKKYCKPELIKTIVEVATSIIYPVAPAPIFLKSFAFTLFVVILVIIIKTGDISMSLAIPMFIIGFIGFPFISSSMASKCWQ